MADYIIREKLLEKLQERDLCLCVTEFDIKSEPAADVAQVRHGRWIHCNGKSNLWYCSECGEKIIYNPNRGTYIIDKKPVYEVNKHCRCCGARMDGDTHG